MTLDLGASPFAGQDIPVTRARKPRGQGATRRGEILAAAKSLFLEEGFERTTMRRIAAVVGISSTALYVYFADKEAILRAIAEQTFKDLIAFLEASQPAGASALDRFRAGLRAYVAFGRSRPDEYRLTFSTKMIGSPSPGRVREPIEAGSTSFALLKDGIARLIQDGTFASGSPYLAAEAIWACLHGVTSLLLDRAERIDSDPDELVEAVIDMALCGLRAVAAKAVLQGQERLDLGEQQMLVRAV